MANSLGINLTKGQIVELNDGRIVSIRGGFGMTSFTMGTALMVADTNGVHFRVSGYDVKCLVKNKEGNNNG